MKKIREYLITAGVSLILVLSVCLARAQTPDVPPRTADADDAAAGREKPADDAEAARKAAIRDRILRARENRTVDERSRNRAAAEAAAQPAPASNSSLTPSTPGVRTISPSSGSLSKDAASSMISPSGNADASGGKNATPSLKFDNTASDIVLMAYAEQTGKTLLIAPDVPKANITLRSQPGVALTAEEYVEAIEVVLSMNGIVLEPFGDKFVKVLARKTVRTDGIEILMTPPEDGHPEKTRIISQMIQLNNITIDEAKTAIEGFKKPDGMIQTFERTNSLLVTDTQENINRMLEIIKFIDQPIPVTEEVFTRRINFAKAEDIKKRLEEIVAESQQAASSKAEVKAKSSGKPGITKTKSSDSSISARLAALRRRRGEPETPQPDTSPNAAIDAMISDADRGMIRGKVQIMADERTNQLIVITRKDNMDFFEKIINVLDIETSPDVKVDVMRLEYADAEEVSSMLNDLIGNASNKKDDSKSASSSSDSSATKSTSLSQMVKARQDSTSSSSSSSSSTPGKSKLGELSKDNIKILSDKRTNAIVMMGSPGDLAAVTEIIRNMDIKLSQVLIETVVLEVSLKDSITTGINWVRRINDSKDFRYTFGGGGTSSAGTSTLFGQTETEETVTEVNEDGDDEDVTVTKTVDDLAGTYLESMSNPVNGLEYFMTLKNLRLDAVISAAQNDSRSRVLSSPVLLTVDNKEASIEATELLYMYKGMRYMGASYGGNTSSYEPDIEQRDVGLTVKVTPRINPNGNVILTIEETFENQAGYQVIDGENWPTITTRKLSADVSVGDGETVVLGGLVQNNKSDSEGGIPYLKDIPYIGKYIFGSTKKENNRSEMLVFLTPYVIDSDEDMRKEARRRKDYLDATDVWTKGWSDSDLADPVPVDEMKTRLARKKALEQRWKKYASELEEHKETDANLVREREKALRILRGDSSTTNEVLPSAGIMKVEEITGPGPTEDEPLPEDEVPEPQRPEIETGKRPWWKLF
ncbi:MAG: type II secretion system secretin GspD [Kiritimatiellia bacterium]